MTSAKLAIDGGAPFRSQPFGPKWIFGDEERRHLMEVMDNATDGWRSGFKVRAFADAFATLHGAKYAVAATTGTGAIHAAVPPSTLNPATRLSPRPPPISAPFSASSCTTPSPFSPTGIRRLLTPTPPTSSAASPPARAPSSPSISTATPAIWAPFWRSPAPMICP